MQYATVYQADTLARLDAERGLVALERRRLIAERQEETGESGKRIWFWQRFNRVRTVRTVRTVRPSAQPQCRGIVAR